MHLHVQYMLFSHAQKSRLQNNAGDVHVHVYDVQQSFQLFVSSCSGHMELELVISSSISIHSIYIAELTLH